MRELESLDEGKAEGSLDRAVVLHTPLDHLQCRSPERASHFVQMGANRTRWRSSCRLIMQKGCHLVLAVENIVISEHSTDSNTGTGDSGEWIQVYVCMYRVRESRDWRSSHLIERQ